MTFIEYKNGIPLAYDNSRVERLAEYWQDIYNFKINPDCDKLKNDNNPSEMGKPLQILKSEVEKEISQATRN